MRGGAAWLSILAFAVCIGDAAWRIWGPAETPRYFLSNSGKAFAPVDPNATVFYLRGTICLPARPKTAWVEVIAWDRCQVYVNEVEVSHKASPGFTVADAIDIAPHLRNGRNVIAIASDRASMSGTLRIDVNGGYDLGYGSISLITGDWRCASYYERGAGAWFTLAFNDRHWERAPRVACSLRGEIDHPPGPACLSGFGSWVIPAAGSAGTVAVRGRFDAPRPHRAAWLRLVTSAAFHLAINGLVVAEQDENLGISGADRPVEYVYDISKATRSGTNTVAVLFTGSNANLPRVRVEGASTDCTGKNTLFASDSTWESIDPQGADWLDETKDSWVPIQKITGYAGVPSWAPKRVIGTSRLPIAELLRHAAMKVGLVSIVFAVTWSTCRWVGYSIRRAPAKPAIATLALLLPTTLVVALDLATYDPRFDFDWRQHGDWFAALIALVPLQWLWLAMMARRQFSPQRKVRSSNRIILATMLMLTILGGWMRARTVTAEPLNPDEVTVYRAAQGIWERGWPSFTVHPDMPVFEMATSEIMFYPVALSVRIFDDDRWAVRAPALFWSILSIPVMYWAGVRIFHSRWIGLTATALYALSPVIIQMSGFGRYFAGLQLATLLMIVCFWQTLTRQRKLDRLSLAATVLAFLVAYLNWEGSALMTIGMIAAALLIRRHDWATIFAEPAVYAGLILIASVIGLQMAHRDFQQSSRLWYGTGASDIQFTPMWLYPNFDLWYYVNEASWNRDWLLPMIGLAAGSLLAIRSSVQKPVRFLVVIFFVTAWLQVLILPVKAARYSYHLAPLCILLASAGLVAGLRWVARIGPRCSCAYVSRIRFLIGAICIAVASGLTLQLEALKSAHSEGYRLGEFKFAHVEGPCRFVFDRLEPGDVILSTAPHVVEHHLGRWSGLSNKRDGLALGFWPESRLHLQAVLDDRRSVPLHRLYGVRMLSSRQDLERLFATHGRIWYIADPHFTHLLNEPTCVDFLREHMEVVAEDFSCLVLFAGNRHRPAESRASDRLELSRAPGANFLP